MTMREQFEAWHTEHFIEPTTRSRGGSDFRNEKVRDRWEAWQASRTAALEEAAQYCSKIMGRVSSSYYSDLIRALGREER
ncbi:hypothetical protein [Paraburkholderia sp. J11-2]|uniref:hypothetical protein n=1 Tax=Paraburkholderia sp. J11-2 TaxID=2805431 RepID=UPI002AB6862B|nr:hypothetical protein [Paraburkholderia sp. J11-2]